MQNRKTSECRFVAIYLLSVFLLTTILGLQGLDMADEGWVLTGYQQIFSHPKSIQYLFLYYLGEYVGGIWNLLFGQFGIVAFRLLTALCYTVVAYVTYRMLRPYFAKWNISAGFLCCILCSSYGVMVFYHNYLTMVLVAGAAYALFLSLMRNDIRWMLVSGFILGVNVFVRLPNVMMVLLILLLIPYRMYSGSVRKTLRLLGGGVMGFLLGILAVFLLMFASGHATLFSETIADGFSAINDESSTHHAASMFGRYLQDYLMIAKTMALLLLIPLSGYYLIVKKKWKSRFDLSLLLLLEGLYIWMLTKTASNLYVVYALATASIIGVVIWRRQEKAYVYLATILLICMYVMPFGSDFGIGNMGENCVWLAGTFVLGLLDKTCRQQVNPTARYWLILNTVMVLLLLVVRGGRDWMSQAYFDDGIRTQKCYRPSHPLATTFTTQRNSELIDELMKQLSPCVKEDDTILCFQNLATIHYLTHTQPYLYNPWPWTYDASNMERKFKKAEAEHAALPIVIREKSSLSTWYQYDANWNRDDVRETYFHHNRKITLINMFLKRHHYKLQWENDVFQIWLPGK